MEIRNWIDLVNKNHVPWLRLNSLVVCCDTKEQIDNPNFQKEIENQLIELAKNLPLK